MSRWISLFVSLSFCAAAQAHHSQAGLFDPTETVAVTGTVKSVSWQNPHGHIVFTVVDASGKAVDWDAETASVSVLRIRGIDTVALKPGDKISVAGSPSRRGAPELLARSMLLPTGYEFTFGGQTPYFPEGKAGKIFSKGVIDADAAQARASADGLFRVWSTIMSDPAAFPMFKGGYPLSAAAKAKMTSWNPRDNELLRCGTKGMPLIMISPLPMEFVKQPNGDILLKIEEYDVRRMIHMAPNTVAPAEYTQFGFSRGRFDGSTLVVTTDHVREQTFDPDGVPQSQQIVLVERFTPTATYDRVDYRLTVTDPLYFDKPFDLTRYFVWKPEDTVHPYECSERY